MDAYQQVRSLSFPVLCGALGIDISKFKLRKGGQEHYGPCPVHAPKSNTTSFSYQSDGLFHCFSCSAKGRGGIDLTKAVKGIGFKEAVELLGGIQASPETTKPVLEPPRASDGVLKPLLKDTWRKFAVPCPWLEARCPDADIRERYGVFCYNNPARRSAYSGRVMLPVKDVEGVLYGYLGRDTLGNPDTCKYLFPRNLPKSRFLFGAHELTRQDTPYNGRLPVRVVYLVESPFCVLKFASLGLPALSPYGWSVSQEQLKCLATIARGIVYLPDRNKADQTSQVVAALSSQIWVHCPPLPVEDPEHLSWEQIQAL